jgi:hypothetical protein
VIDVVVDLELEAHLVVLLRLEVELGMVRRVLVIDPVMGVDSLVVENLV